MDLSAEETAEVFQIAAEENRLDSLRREQVVRLPEAGRLLLAADIHDHRRNFDKLIRLADLGAHRQTHLVLQELIHGDHYDADGGEDSWRILLRAAQLKADYSGQVHFLLSNHDWAQIQGEGLLKNGLSVCAAFNKGVKAAFGNHAATVTVAITEFLLSFPLAVRTDSGLFCCHSIPADDKIAGFDYTLFERPAVSADYVRKSGWVYQLVWGRDTSAARAEEFADRVGAKILVTGHQPQEAGFSTNGARQVILASDHNQGVFLEADLAQTYDLGQLVQCLHKFVAVE